MAAISLIAGSILGWIAAGCAMMAGALFSTAFVVFLLTSLGFAGLTIFASVGRQARGAV